MVNDLIENKSGRGQSVGRRGRCLGSERDSDSDLFLSHRLPGPSRLPPARPHRNPLFWPR